LCLISSDYDPAAATTAAEFAGPPPPPTGRSALRGLGDVDRQGPAVNALAIQASMAACASFGRAHGDEAETAGTAAFAVHHQVDFGDGAWAANASWRSFSVVLKEYFRRTIYYYSMLCDVL